MTALQATKWVSIQALLDLEELKSLFSLPFSIIQVGRIIEPDKKILPHEAFFKIYEEYLKTLDKESFSLAITADESALFEQHFSDKILVRPKLPVIQMQHAAFHFSEESRKIYPKVYGKDTVSWGLHFSFPQLYLDEETKEAVKSRGSPNGELFHTFQKWTREHTIPTTFLYGDEKIATPLRLGKKCLPWINNHPQLNKLKVIV